VEHAVLERLFWRLVRQTVDERQEWGPFGEGRAKRPLSIGRQCVWVGDHDGDDAYFVYWHTILLHVML
jgi:hypothetical protein